jgi:hypothetical protein
MVRWAVMVLLSLLVGLSCLAGCAAKEDGSAERLALVKQTNPKSMDVLDVSDGTGDLEEKVENQVEQYDQIYDVVVIRKQDQVLVAYKVKHLQRFRMKKIEKQVTDQLEKQFKDVDFIVSSDYKIFLESVRLNKNLRENDVSEKQAKKKFDEIVSLKEELT